MVASSKPQSGASQAAPTPQALTPEPSKPGASSPVDEQLDDQVHYLVELAEHASVMARQCDRAVASALFAAAARALADTRWPEEDPDRGVPRA